MTDEPVVSLPRRFLLPGEYLITLKPKYIATLLGSCVAVCLYNQVNGSAAMNHYLHDRGSTHEPDVGRYGNLATEHIIQGLFSVDAEPRHYTARIFGGAAVVGSLAIGGGIGNKNILIAQELLHRYGIRIVEQQIGGRQGRKIYFNTAENSVQTSLIGEHTRDFSRQNIRVLVVDDSALVRDILCRVIAETPGMEVAGCARDAYEARDMLISLDPDVVSLDIIMPRLDGLKFLAKIMRYYPKPVVIVSTIAKEKSDIADKAVKLGAAGTIDKDSLEIYKGLDIARHRYVPLLRTAAARIIRTG